MSSNVMGRDEKAKLARLLLCAGMLAATGCVGDERGVGADEGAEPQAQIGEVTRNPGSRGVTRTPVTPVAPVTPTFPTQPSSAGIVGPIKRCTALGNLELATCQQRWEELPSGRAILDLGRGFADVHFKLLGVGNRHAYIQGDIIVGDEGSIRSADRFADVEAAARISTGSLWPSGRIPYEIDPAVSDPGRITQAIAAWEAVTRVRFVPRTTELDYVRMVDGTGCASYVGRVGGAQVVQLNAGCTLGNTIHELGHLIGLWHEQSRLDRDKYVQILLDNIVDANEHNFDTIAGSFGSGDIDSYNFGSIMHYPLNAFAIDPSKPTISVRPGIAIPADVIIGQRSGLSDGDIGAVNQIYCNAFGGTLCR